MFLGQSESGAPSKSSEAGVGVTCYNFVDTMVHGKMVLEIQIVRLRSLAVI